MKKKVVIRDKQNKAYEARILEMLILRRYPNIRFEADYEGMKDWIIERTMSCDKGEQIGWMKYYMIQALEEDERAVKTAGIGGNAREGMRHEAAVQFIAAYDLI